MSAAVTRPLRARQEAPTAPIELPDHVPPTRSALAPLTLSAARLGAAIAPRTKTGIAELDRVLGGGLVDGSVVLIGGDPGCGKSTLLMQVIHELTRHRRDRGALYASAEESEQQIALRATRLGIENERVDVVASEDIDAILNLAHRVSPAVLVIDSIQTMRTSHLDGAPGSMAQVAECAGRLARFAKASGVPVLIVGQVTKDGELAGPNTLKHLVDVVLYLETAGGARRHLTSPKNRFGSTSEVGVLEMRETGLVSIDNTDSLSERAEGASGSAVFPALVGERVQLVEVQALVGPVKDGDRAKGSLSASGVDPKRVAMILAVLARHAGIDVSERDVYVSVTGGARVTDPAADLAIALAIASSYRDLPIDATCASFGELGLAGEVRSVAYAHARAEEARRGGFDLVLAPKADAGEAKGEAAKTIGEAIGMSIGEELRS
jgi:DNA repair protein RadA/Sms